MLCGLAPLDEQAKKQLGWEPKVALREGLSRMVSDFAKRLDVPVPDVPGRPA
jgi:nucleoside-diphosphate-sugar epimerase